MVAVAGVSSKFAVLSTPQVKEATAVQSAVAPVS